jgi:hypothetical protein
MSIGASRVQYIWSPLLGWALLTCSASIALAQIGVAVPGISDAPAASSNQANPTTDQTTGAPGNTASGVPTVADPAPAPVVRPSIPVDISLPAGTTVANPSTQVIPGASDTFAGTTGGAPSAGFSAVSYNGAPSGDELGITIGSFRLYPTIDITVGVDSNPFTQTSTSTPPPQASLSTTISPSLALRSEWLNHSINFLLGGGFGYYSTASTQNYQNYFLIVDGRVDVRDDLAVAYSFGYRRATEALGTPNVAFAQAPTVAESIPLTLALTKKFNRLSVEVGGSATRSWFTDFSTITVSGLDAASRNRTAYEEHIRLGYDISDDLTVFITPSISQLRYDLTPDTSGQDRNSTQAGLAIGANWVISAITSITGNVGLTTTSGALGSTSATTFSLSGSYNGYAPLTLRPNLSRSITESALSAYRNIVQTTLGMDYNYQIFDEFVLSGGISYSLSDYQPIDGLGASPREDAFARASIGFLWSPRPQFSIGPVYEYTQGSSSDANGPAYNRQIISIRLSARR